MVPYKASPGCPHMPKIHIWLAYMRVIYGPIYDFFARVMEERRIFSSDGMKNASILFWRSLGDSLDSKLSPSVREKRIDDFFIS